MITEFRNDRDIMPECIDEITQGSKIVVDLGASKRFHGKLSEFRSQFDGINYFAMDITFNPDLDVVGDIQHIPIKDESVDAIISNAVLYFVYEPIKAVEEIYRILKQGGKGFFYVPFLYPYHGNGNHPDLYRFTKDSLLWMFRDFRRMKIQPIYGYVGVTLRFILGFGFKGNFKCKLIQSLETLVELLAKLIKGRKPDRFRNTTGFQFLVEK